TPNASCPWCSQTISPPSLGSTTVRNWLGKSVGLLPAWSRWLISVMAALQVAPSERRSCASISVRSHEGLRVAGLASQIENNAACHRRVKTLDLAHHLQT